MLFNKLIYHLAFVNVNFVQLLRFYHLSLLIIFVILCIIHVYLYLNFIILCRMVLISTIHDVFLNLIIINLPKEAIK